MTQQLYDALKNRISTIATDSDEFKVIEEDFREKGWFFDPECPIYRIHISDLGEDFFDVVQPIRSTNMWNVAQRLYSHISYQDGIEEALLKPTNKDI